MNSGVASPSCVSRNRQPKELGPYARKIPPPFAHRARTLWFVVTAAAVLAGCGSSTAGVDPGTGGVRGGTATGGAAGGGPVGGGGGQAGQAGSSPATGGNAAGGTGPGGGAGATGQGTGGMAGATQTAPVAVAPVWRRAARRVDTRRVAPAGAPRTERQ